MDFVMGTMDAKAICCVGASIEALGEGASNDIDGSGGVKVKRSV